MENLLSKLELTNPSIEDLKKLTLFLNDAQNAIRLYTNLPIIPPEIAFIAEELAVKRFRMFGSEHLSNESISGVSFSYSDNLSGYTELLDKVKVKSRKLRAL